MEPGSGAVLFVYDSLDENDHELMVYEGDGYTNGTLPPSLTSTGPSLALEFDSSEVEETLMRAFKV